MWEVSGSVPGYESGYRMVTFVTIIPQCERSVIKVLVVRVDIRVVLYESVTPYALICYRTISVQFL